MAPDVLEALKALAIPQVPGGFGTVLADPPWSFQDKGSRAAPDWKEAPLYSTMGAREILDLPVDLLAAPDAHLYLWTTDSHLPLALSCVDAWGFSFRKVLVWVKRRSATTPIRCEDGEDFQVLNGPLQIGMGHTYRSAKELCLFAVRGKAPARVHNLPDTFEAPRTQHSRKPDRIHEWAEQLSPGPRLELFARRSREGWEAWGDQFPGHDAYVRQVERINAHRVEARAVTLAKRARRRASIRFDKLTAGISQFGARCSNCQGTICQGDLHHYQAGEPGAVCHPCFVAWQSGSDAA